MKLKTKGRDLETEVEDFIAEQDVVIDTDKFHVASIRFPPDVTRVRLKSSDKTPEAELRTLTVEAIEGGGSIQRKIQFWHLDTEKWGTFNVKERTVLMIFPIRRNGKTFETCIELSVSKR